MSRRLIASFKGPKAGDFARVYRESELDEFRVVFRGHPDYVTDDRADAIGTARITLDR